MTNASQVQSIPDLNDSIDISNISQDTILSTTSMASKKGGKARGRSTRAKKAEPTEVVEASEDAAEDDDIETPDVVPRGTKRKSEEISEDYRGGRDSTVKPEPPPRRRATRSRNSEAQQIGYPSLDALENSQHKAVLGGGKRAPSRSRKMSSVSAATTASLRADVADDVDIEAALEADLDKAMPDMPRGTSEALEELPKPKTRGRAKKTKASTAPARSTRQATAESEESLPVSEVKRESKAALRGKGRKGRATKKTVNEKFTPSSQAPDESAVTIATNADSQFTSSVLMSQPMADDSGHETDASLAPRKSVTRKGNKRKANAKAKGKNTGVMSQNIEDIVQTKEGSRPVARSRSAADADLNLITAEKDLTKDRKAEEAPMNEEPERATRATRGAKAKANTTKKAKTKLPQLSMPGTFSPLMGDVDPSFNSVLANSSPPVAPIAGSGLSEDALIPVTLERSSSQEVSEAVQDNASTPAEIRPSLAEMQTPTRQRNKNTTGPTPSPSPQSSDAENQPPSSRPPSARPPLALLSPTKDPMQRIPLAPGTPTPVPLSPSKIEGSCRRFHGQL